MKAARRLGAAVILIVVLAGTASAQNSPFTPDDMLKVASISVLDVTEDGRFVAASVRRPIDNPTNDHRRFGDPTYLAPSLVTLQIIRSRSWSTSVTSPGRGMARRSRFCWRATPPPRALTRPPKSQSGMRPPAPSPR